MRIEICGGIATGKTTLTKQLSHMGFGGVFEDFSSIAFLSDFYETPELYTYETEIAFLLQHTYQIKKRSFAGKVIVCDYSIEQDFAYAMNNLHKQEMESFKQVYNISRSKMEDTTLIICLQAKPWTLKEQADERNRIVERKEVPLFHAEAYREAVINAFVHNLWIDGNAPMFTGFRDRIEILSRGHLPPKQTVEGFFAGESVPVNQKLSDIFLQLHISERSGRGIPKITELYGEDCIELRENSIVVTIPFERLETKAYAPVDDENVPDRTEIPSVGTEIPPVGIKIPSDRSENPLLKEPGIEERILRFCAEAKNIQEIMEHLGYRDKKTVRKYLSPLLQQGRISMTIPDKPNSKNQKYITIK